MNRKVDRIILRDIADTQFDDLITFDKEVNLIDIIDKIENLKKEKEDYTNEDVYKVLSELSSFEIIWLGQYDIVEY